MTPKPPVKEIKKLFVNQRGKIIFHNSQRALTRVCICPHPLLLSAVSRKVVHRDFHTLPLFEFAQGVRQQVEVKGVWVVKVVVVAGCQVLLFSRKDLRTRQGPVISWFLCHIVKVFFYFGQSASYKVIYVRLVINTWAQVGVWQEVKSEGLNLGCHHAPAWRLPQVMCVCV